MERVLSVVAVVALVGCEPAQAPQPEQMAWSEHANGPDGTDHILVGCKEMMGHCYKEAGRVCLFGYKSVKESTTEGEVKEAWAYGKRAEATSVPKFRGSLLVKCNGAPPPKG